MTGPLVVRARRTGVIHWRDCRYTGRAAVAVDAAGDGSGALARWVTETDAEPCRVCTPIDRLARWERLDRTARAAASRLAAAALSTPDERNPMLGDEVSYDEQREMAEARFFTAAAGGPPTEAQRASVARLRELVVELGAEIEMRVPAGRNKAIALRSLEDVQMRANRGLFAPPEVR